MIPAEYTVRLILWLIRLLDQVTIANPIEGIWMLNKFRYFVYETVENMVTKGENAGYQYFSVLHKVLQQV